MLQGGGPSTTRTHDENVRTHEKQQVEKNPREPVKRGTVQPKSDQASAVVGTGTSQNEQENTTFSDKNIHLSHLGVVKKRGFG